MLRCEIKKLPPLFLLSAFFVSSFSSLSASDISDCEARAEKAFNRSLSVLAGKLGKSDEEAWKALQDVNKAARDDLSDAILAATPGTIANLESEKSSSHSLVPYADIHDFVYNGLEFKGFSSKTVHLHIQNFIAPVFAEGSSFYTCMNDFGFNRLFKDHISHQVSLLSKPLPEVSGSFELMLNGTDEICGEVKVENSPEGYRIKRFKLSESGYFFLKEASLLGLSQIDELIHSESKDDNTMYQALLNLETVNSISETFQSEKNQGLFSGTATPEQIKDALDDVKKQKNIKNILGVGSLDEIEDLNWVRGKINTLTAVSSRSYIDVVQLLTSIDEPVKTVEYPEGRHTFYYSPQLGEFQICHFLCSTCYSFVDLNPIKKGNKDVEYAPHGPQFGAAIKWRSDTGLDDLYIRFLPGEGHNPVLQFEYPYNDQAILPFILVEPSILQ